jgi:hypothetical protein
VGDVRYAELLPESGDLLRDYVGGRPPEQDEAPILRAVPHDDPRTDRALLFGRVQALRQILDERPYPGGTFPAIPSGERIKSIRPLPIALSRISGCPAVSSLCSIVMPSPSLMSHSVAAPSPS